MTARRDEILDAAIRVLGNTGSRGLTHRRVDEEASLPLGSTSNYFRTRDALVAGVVDRLERLDVAGWESQDTSAAATSVAQLADILTGFVLVAVTSDRARTQARYALFVEAAIAGGDSPIAVSIERSRATLIGWGVHIAASLGLSHPERVSLLLVDLLDGMILHQLTRPGPDQDEIRARILAFLESLAIPS